MGVFRPRTWRLCQVQVLNFWLVVIEGEMGTCNGEWGHPSFFSRHARRSSKSPFALKKKSRRLLNAGYKGQRDKDKT